MEREPRHEQEPLVDDCMHCEKQYDLTKDNSRTYEYTKQPECNNLLMLCPHCDGLTRMFIEESGSTLEQIKSHNLPIVTEDYAPQEMYKAWLDAMGIELIKENEVTPRQQKRVDFLGYLLEHDMIVPNDFK